MSFQLFLSTLKRSLQKIYPPLIWSSTWAMASPVPCNSVFVGPNTLVLAHFHDGSVGSGCYSLELWTLHLSLALKDEGWSKGWSKPPGSNGAFWNFQQLAQFLFLPWSCSELPCWQAAACEMCTFQSKWLQELIIAAKRVWILIAHFH